MFISLKGGEGFFYFKDKTISEVSSMRVYYDKPKRFTADRPIVFLMHGADRKVKHILMEAASVLEKYIILLKRIFSLSFLILLGEEDVVQDDYFLKTKAARRQGDNRLQRGKKFYSTAEKEAQRLNIRLQWQHITIPGCGHNPNDEMINVVIQFNISSKKLRLKI